MFGDIVKNRKLQKSLKNVIVEEEDITATRPRSRTRKAKHVEKEAYKRDCTDCWFCSSGINFQEHYCTAHKERIYDTTMYAFNCRDYSEDGF